MGIAIPAADIHVQAQTRTSRLRQQWLSDTDRNFAIAMHLSPLALCVLGAGPLCVLGPLVLWLVRRNHSVFNDDHGREVVNFGISFILWHVIAAVTIIGIVLIPVFWVVAVVNLIRGAVAAGNGEYFRYPMTIRFIK